MIVHPRYQLDSATRCVAKPSYPQPLIYFTHTDSIIKEWDWLIGTNVKL